MAEQLDLTIVYEPGEEGWVIASIHEVAASDHRCMKRRDLERHLHAHGCRRRTITRADSERPRRIPRVRKPERLYFTDSDEANELIASDPLALLIGFALDQQVTVQKAFSGPLAIKQRLGSLDAAAIAEADLEAVFREKPAVHRFPGSMAKRVRQLSEHVCDRYDGDAAAVWTHARDARELRANIEALPGFGEMKVIALAAVLAKRFGVKAAEGLVPDRLTLGDVDSAQALAEYQAQKKAEKAERKLAAGR